MKYIPTTFKYLAALAGLALVTSCANDLQQKENLAAAAGFKSISPTKPDQQAILAKLPKDQVTQVKYNGKVYYVLPDAPHNQAWVGGPKQYQAYQELRVARQISNDNLMAAQMNDAAAMNWDSWGGWGGPGWYGWY